MAKIQILGQFECVTESGILAVAEQIKYSNTTVADALGNKQDALTFDSEPTSNSLNPVTSGGLYLTLETLETELKEYADDVASSANVTLRRIVVSKSGWVLDESHPRYSTNILPGNVETKKYYDVHLSSNNSEDVDIKCAKSDIRVIAESDGLYLHAFNATADAGWSNNEPDFDFEIEIITIPITSDTVGLSYDLGDDFVIAITAPLEERVDELESGLGTVDDTPSEDGTTVWSRVKQLQTDVSSINSKIGSYTDVASASSTVVWPRLKNAESEITSIKEGLGTSSDEPSSSGSTAWSRIIQSQSDIAEIKEQIDGVDLTALEKMILCAQNRIVDTSSWVESGDTAYPYKSEVSMPGLDNSYFPVVQFSDEDVSVFDFSPNTTPKTDAVVIYAKSVPNRSISIPNIICFKGKTV